MAKVPKPVVALVVLLWLVDQSFGNDDIISDISEYKMLIRTYTGYDYSDVKLPYTQVDQESVVELRWRIIRDLVCSYTYSGSHYVRMSGYLLEEPVTPHGSADRFLFTDEASAMLATLYDRGESAQPLWWIFMYANYVQSIVAGHRIGDRPDVVSFTRQAVENYLADYRRQTDCGPNNLFNDRYHRSDDHGHLLKLVDCGGHCLAAAVDGMDFSKRHVADQLAYNEQFVGVVNGSRLKYFTLDHLGLAPAVLETLMCDFAELTDCRWTLNRMLRDYDSASETGQRIEQRMTGVARAQSALTALLKIVMLQITRKHVIYVNELLPAEGVGALCSFLASEHFATANRLNAVMSARLSAFAGFMDLTDDDDRYFGTALTKYFKKNFRRGHNGNDDEDFVNGISIELEHLSARLYECEISFPKVLDENYAYAKSSISRVKRIARAGDVQVDDTFETEPLPIRDSLISATVFLKYITRHMDVDFKVVRSFVRFEQNLQRYMNTSRTDANTSTTEIHTAKTDGSAETK